MTEESTLVEMAEDAGANKVCIELMKDRIADLEERPCLPKWIAKWFSTLTIASFVAVIGFGAVSYYRLGQVEKQIIALNVKYDRLVWGISVELSQSKTTTPEIIASIPKSGASQTGEKSKILKNDSDMDSARSIYTRLLAKTSVPTKL